MLLNEVVIVKWMWRNLKWFGNLRMVPGIRWISVDLVRCRDGEDWLCAQNGSIARMSDADGRADTVTVRQTENRSHRFDRIKSRRGERKMENSSQIEVTFDGCPIVQQASNTAEDQLQLVNVSILTCSRQPPSPGNGWRCRDAIHISVTHRPALFIAKLSFWSSFKNSRYIHSRHPGWLMEIIPAPVALANPSVTSALANRNVCHVFLTRTQTVVHVFAFALGPN